MQCGERVVGLVGGPELGAQVSEDGDHRGGGPVHLGLESTAAFARFQDRGQVDAVDGPELVLQWMGFLGIFF